MYGMLKRNQVMKIRKMEGRVGGNSRVSVKVRGPKAPKKGHFLGLLEITLPLHQDWTLIKMSENWDHSALEKNNKYDDSLFKSHLFVSKTL